VLGDGVAFHHPAPFALSLQGSPKMGTVPAGYFEGTYSFSERGTSEEQEPAFQNGAPVYRNPINALGLYIYKHSSGVWVVDDNTDEKEYWGSQVAPSSVNGPDSSSSWLWRTVSSSFVAHASDKTKWAAHKMSLAAPRAQSALLQVKNTHINRLPALPAALCVTS